MMTPNLNDPCFYLQTAKYFNQKWHEQMTQLMSKPDTSDVHQALMTAQAKLYLEQKTDCQLTALRMAYDGAMTDGKAHDECGVVLELDPNEKGVSGDGVYYGLYPVGQFGLACHIPKQTLLVGLTADECAFFCIK